ncbi:hypothetical protein ACERII_23440 [Evansella sp. AB-rgal1]|uniref:hypothetical protein n=1 Tax=Evansella sp. AB-rgal1 TaxID=3242696 RepID=UPI00359E6689
MNRFISNTIISISIIQCILILILSIYYFYLGIEWGMNERLMLLMLSDSAYALLIPSTIALLLRKQWGWWYTVIVYCKLFLAKITAVIAEMYMLYNNTIAEPFQISIFIFDVLLIFLFVAVICFFFISKVRSYFCVQMKKNVLLFFMIISALILYVMHVITMLLVIKLL